MNRYLRVGLTAAVFASVFGNMARAQAPTPSSTQPPATTIKLQVVLLRYEGDKKLSSLPYTLSLVPGQRGSIRAGAEVPVPTQTLTQGDKAPPTSYTMQQVGSQVDATVNQTTDGKFRLSLNVTDRSIGTSSQGTQGRVPNVPSFRNMTTSSEAILSDGETIQFTTSTDPSSNETFRIDVTLTLGNK